MATYYLEIIEDVPEEEMDLRPPQTAQLQVADEAEATSRIDELTPAFEGLEYTVYFHTCRHDEGKSCERKELV